MEIRDLLRYQSSDRSFRTYAFLATSLREQPKTRDVLDCLIPFLSAGLDKQPAGAELDLPGLAAFLRSLGLHIPDFVLQEFRRRLQQLGLLDWSQGRFTISKPSAALKPVEGAQAIEQAFGLIENDIVAFTKERFPRYDFTAPPASPTWSEALIEFFQAETSLTVYKSANVERGDRKPFMLDQMLVSDPGNVQKIVVARYIQECERTPEKARIFDAIIAVFTGVVIEDFIANLQTVADKRSHRNVCVYYDTTVLLRLLGTSGQLLRLAALDMHNAVQALGWRTFYLEMTRQETWRILGGVAEDPIRSHPESAEAYIGGEFTRDEIADLPDTFADKLKRFGILRAPVVAFQKNWEINEDKLASMLVAASETYKLPSARKDAKAIATVLQLRKGETSTEIGLAKHVFASSNRLLHSVARDFVTESIEDYERGSIPPVLTVGQVATVAWLSTSRDIGPINASRELLTACYSAVRPSGDWIGKFAGTFDSFLKQNPQEVAEDANSNIFLRTTRLLMQDHSLGRSEPADLSHLELAVRQAREAGRRTDYEAEIANTRVRQLEAELSLATVRASELEKELALSQETAPEPPPRIDPDVQAAELEVYRARLEELEARLRGFETPPQAPAPDHLAPAGPRPRDHKLLETLCYLAILILILGALLLSHTSWFTTVGIVVVCVVTLPIMWAYVFRHDELSGTDLIRSYQVGVSAIPLIGTLFSGLWRTHHALSASDLALDDPPRPAPSVIETEPTPSRTRPNTGNTGNKRKKPRAAAQSPPSP